MKKIDILVTLGPRSLKPEVIRALSQQGVSLFRINLSHTPLDEIESTIKTIQEHTNVPLCLDSEGAQIRNQSIKNGQTIFKKGDLVKIHFTPIVGDETNISFTPTHVARSLKVGDQIEIDFHSVSIRVIQKTDKFCMSEVEIGGKVGSNKAVDVNRDIPLEPITVKDKAAIEIGKTLNIANFALSFASSLEDVLSVRKLIGKDSKLISKIENHKSLLNLNEILKESDAILIDRGDLSRQIPIEKIPFLQRKIIASAKYQKTPVYVATNLLESMTSMHLPTRAEVNDVVSTLLMGADGLVLAAETAMGDYPLETLSMINKLVDQFHRWTPNTNIRDILENSCQ